MKLWDKGTSVNSVMETFTVGSDNELDCNYFFPFDIRGTKAHAKALCRAGVLTESELVLVLDELTALNSKWKSGEVTVPVSDEDCHTTIEAHLTSTLGDTGRKIHTGRSRNDQALTMIRLWMQDTLRAGIMKPLLSVEAYLQRLSARYDEDLFIGYTHTQQAMPITLGHYFDSYREQLADLHKYIDPISYSLNSNPLGSGAGFGSSVDIDRNLTSRELGFTDVQVNSLYCQNSRGLFELRYVHALSQVMMTLQKIATDMILYTSREFGFFDTDASICTGSSMMPQKRNLDIAELIRANHAMVMGYETQLHTLSHGLMSGYNRDYQLMKKCIVDAYEATHGSIKATLTLLAGITPNREAIKSKLNVDIFTTDLAISESIKTGKPFRTVYKTIMSDIENIQLTEEEMLELVKTRVTLGSPGNYRN